MIDILLSTYNGEKFLSELLDSLLRQTLKDWRLLLRDDGSTDSTLAIYRAYMQRDNRFCLLGGETAENVGVKRSFEILLSNAQADYIMFCDHDDVWLPEKISHAFSCMQDAEAKEGKQVPIIVYSDLMVADENVDIIDPSFWHYERLYPQYISDFSTLAGMPFVTGCTMMINSAAKAISLPFPKEATLHDYYISLQVMAHNGKFYHNPYSDILYRQHGNNVCGAVEAKTDNWIVKTAKRIFGIRGIMKQNLRYYAQAKQVQNISITDYISHKLAYKRKANG